MPAQSDKQRKLMGLAEHQPQKVHKANKGVLKMSHEQLHDFASTKGLKSTKKKETREGMSIIDVEEVKRAPEKGTLMLPGRYYKPGEEGTPSHEGLGNDRFLKDSGTAIVVDFYGPDTDFRAEEINPQHYGRDYEPAPWKDMFKTPEKAWEKGIRIEHEECYQDCETPGSVEHNQKSVEDYNNTTPFSDKGRDFDENRSFDEQMKFRRLREERESDDN